MAARRVEADLILADVGPNLGAINRSVLIGSDFVVIPLGADLFSLQGLKNLGPTLRSWRNLWRKSLGRANAAKFVKALCQYPGATSTIKEAQEHILKAHAERLTKELADAQATGTRQVWMQEFKFTGERVTVEDMRAGRAPRPRVLDMFAGGGAIPLEALRLGCEAYALDLNPVAHIIQLCTLVYPQKFGKPDPNVRGMTGPKNAKGEATWGGLAEEVRYWGNWVLLYGRPERPIRRLEGHGQPGGHVQQGRSQRPRRVRAGLRQEQAPKWRLGAPERGGFNTMRPMGFSQLFLVAVLSFAGIG